MIRSVQYDETPIKLTMVEDSKEKDTKIAKVMHLEVEVGVVVRGPITGDKAVYFHGEVATHLYVLERSTAECIAECVDRARNIDGWDSLREFFTAVVEASSCDRAACNLRAEAHFAASRPTSPHLLLPCEVHMLSTIQQKAVETGFDADISGMIAAALSMQIAGSSDQLRKCMEKVILSNLDIFEGAAQLPDDDPSTLYRRRLLDETLGNDLANMQRKKVLDACCNGDVREESIAHFGNMSGTDIAKAVAAALLPRALPIFPRHRWLSSAECIAEASLLFNWHHIFARAVKAWISDQHKETDAGGDFRPDHHNQEALVPISEQLQQQGSAADRAKENARNRSGLKNWVESNPGKPLLILLLSMRPQVKLLSRYFREAGVAWDKNQHIAMMLSGKREYR
jgi:hypothetical protein